MEEDPKVAKKGHSEEQIPRALGVARQRVSCATGLLTRSTMVGVSLLVRAAGSGFGPALTANGITASGKNVGMGG